jgi:hypothetical protein
MKIETHLVRSSRSLTSRLVAFVAIAVVSALTAGNAWAKDSMTVSVTNTVPTPHVVNNGEAVGTIQLFYTVNADAFMLGDFATFDINWLTSAVDAKKATDYGTGVLFKLEQDQQGGFVDLQPSPETFTLTKTGQTGTARQPVCSTSTTSKP